jgi:hypothetical protein
VKRVYTIGAAAAKIESLLVLRFQVTAIRPVAGFELRAIVADFPHRMGQTTRSMSDAIFRQSHVACFFNSGQALGTIRSR